MDREKKDEIIDYDFDIVEIIKAGFVWIDGVKLQFLVAFFLYVVIAVVTQTLLGLVFPTSTGEEPNFLNGQIVGILSYPVLMPLIAGIMMMGLKRTRDEEVKFASMFDYYSLMGKLALAGIVIYIMTIIGLLLFILPGIYLTVAYIYAPMLIIEKDMGVWEAMEYSRKAVSKHWFKVAGLMLALGLIMFFGFLALGIGLIWAVPLMFVTLYGLLYPVIFEAQEG
jgi:uncharacterized membrane protein